MSPRFSQLVFGIAVLGGGLAGCTHTPPGTSVEIALARRPEVVSTPAPVVATISGGVVPAPGAPRPAYQPEKTELVADAFSRGEFCMKAGKTDEAISAFREAVQIDPKFSAAWGMLATLYEQGGQEQAALEAFRKAKTQQ